ncbi:MAG TPA: ComEA family DNA-binding protein [Acidimicrobiia bacterium]
MPDAAPPERPGFPDPAFWGGGPRRGRRRPRRPLPDGPWQRALDVFDVWRADARLGLALLVIAAVVVGVVWYRIGVGGGSDPPPRRAADAHGAAPSITSTAGPTTTDRRGVLVVHVAGAVATPGVVELAAGSRVIDAVEAAGGAADGADLDRLNLAAKVADGERVLVQRVGDPPSPGAPGDGEAGGSSGAGGSTPARVNLNTASQADLESLPGIGPVLAAAIIDERQRRGGFRSVQELRDVDGIGEKRFAELEDLVTA